MKRRDFSLALTAFLTGCKDMAWYTKGGSLVVSGGQIVTDAQAGQFVFTGVFSGSVTSPANGGVITVNRSSGTFAAKTFGSGAPWLYDNVSAQYLNGVNQNAYNGFTDGQALNATIWGVSAGGPSNTAMGYYTSRALRTSFDSALYGSVNMNTNGKGNVGAPVWPGAYGTQTNQTMFLSFWGKSANPFQGTGGGDGSTKILRVSQVGDVQYRGGANIAASGTQNYYNSAASGGGDIQPSFATIRNGNAGNWMRHDCWWDTTSGGSLSSAGQLINMWNGVMGSGIPFTYFSYSGNSGNFEACHVTDILYTSNQQTNTTWTPATALECPNPSTPCTFTNIVPNLLGYDDGHGLSAGNNYDMCGIYLDADFQRPEIADSATWDVSPTSTMNREIQGVWQRNSSTQIQSTILQGQFAALAGKYLYWVNGRGTAEQIGHWV
jgi:hypothetical protein